MKRLFVLVSLGMMLAIPSAAIAQIKVDWADVGNTPGLTYSATASRTVEGEGAPYTAVTTDVLFLRGWPQKQQPASGKYTDPLGNTSTMVFPSPTEINLVEVKVEFHWPKATLPARVDEAQLEAYIDANFVQVASGAVTWVEKVRPNPDLGSAVMAIDPAVKSTQFRIRFDNCPGNPDEPTSVYQPMVWITDIIACGKGPLSAPAAASSVPDVSCLERCSGRN